MLSRSEINRLIIQAPNLKDMTPSLSAILQTPGGIVRETQAVIALARKFTREVVKPYVLELEKKMTEDPDYLPWEFVKKANEWGFYTMWIPKLFGGKGYNMASMSSFVEEVGSVCLAMANLIGVHYLGVATLVASWNVKLIDRLCRDVVNGEKTGEPCLISLAITEPGAGTDVEEMELADKGDIICKAEKVNGGFRLNGSKIFISNGHISTWHMTIAYMDLKKPSHTTIMAAVKTGSEGFSFGRMERKMGQKGCPASELIFKDCFIPDDLVAIDTTSMGKRNRSKKETIQQIIDYVVSATRAGVAAFATGAARGAFETAIQFAAETEVNGKLLINHEWAQCMLAEMYKNIALARLSYIETNHANNLHGMYKLLQMKPIYYFLKFTPRSLFDKISPILMKQSVATWIFRKLQLDGQTDEAFHCTSGWGSLAKFSATDLGIRNCHMALELMGQAGLRHDRYAEKFLRDAKLLQIYEGTNQLNRLNVFKCFLQKDHPQSVVFDE